MTGLRDKIYPEVYQGHQITIDRLTQMAPGGVGQTDLTAVVDDYTLPQTFDHCSIHSGRSPTEPNTLPTPQASMALAAARAYCDRNMNSPPM